MTDSILITGGAGFIGCHTAAYFAARGYRIVLIDTLVRPGAERNLDWLRTLHIPLTHYAVDVRDFNALATVVQQEGPFAAVIHLAAQVAVTTSVADPRTDFEINACGTFNMLECLRKFTPESLFIYASTNKVYGELLTVPVKECAMRYTFHDQGGIGEQQPLDFHSPYGCSKGCGDQYVIDFARIYGLRTVSFRQSCIYGERQFGIEDQGWVAWFIIAGVLQLPVTVYGNGKQVRDLLYIQDLTELYGTALEHKDHLDGVAFNIGGGTDNALSLLEFIDILKGYGLHITCEFEPWRPGDQKIFISDNTKASALLGWKPRTSYHKGFAQLIRWVEDNREVLREVLRQRRLC
ncbi:MAG: GDP-mannose 4,6-dehydratase [Desulfobacterota bacterium]|nr:GDP-mannose 4,6-dehydratase [Thermodesulfobacteriota bacterium]